MSDERDDYWDALINRKRELAEKAATQRLSKQEQEELLAEYKVLLDKLEPCLQAQLERMKIHFELMARQGTIEPDFTALYKRKAELDRKLLGEP
jgi:hypothetical protein